MIALSLTLFIATAAPAQASPPNSQDAELSSAQLLVTLTEIRFPENAGNLNTKGMSEKGDVAIGFFGNVAFRWDRDKGLQELNHLPGAKSSQALGVSGDGTIVIGMSGSKACYWEAPSSDPRPLPVPAESISAARVVSADGKVIVGAYSIDGVDHLFRSSKEGPLVDIPIPARTRIILPLDISADGTSLVG